MSVIIKSGTSSDLAKVDANNALQVGTTLTPANVGLIGVAAEVDPGTIFARTVRPYDCSDDYRLRVGVDNLFFQEQFAGTAVNTSNWNNVISTMTTSVTGGFVILNNGSSLTSGAHDVLKTYRSVPMYGTYPTYVEIRAMYAASAVITNTVSELGVGLATTTSAPTDGCFFRWNASGEFRAFFNNNGTESQSELLTAPTVNEAHHFLIIISFDLVEFWIDGVLRTRLSVPVGQSTPTASQNLPILIRTYNSAVPSSAVQIKVAEVLVTVGDMLMSRPWASALVGTGQGAYQGQTGATLGQTANYANSTVPTSATLSNTAAGYTTLGGQFQFAAVAGAETDFALFGYQVVAGTAAIPGKNLYVTGISIDTYNTGAAVGATATVLQWAVGVGATAVSLATAEAVTTKAPRRSSIGNQTMPAASAIGFLCARIDTVYPTPLMVENACFLHIILKMPVGLATASQVIRGTVYINGYFE